MASQFDKYIWQMSDSAKLSADEIRRLHAGIPSERAETVAGEAFVQELLRLQKLTPRQATSLLEAVNPGIELGEFLLLERLGQSRSAMVFRAEHRRLHRVVTVKVLAPHLLKQTGGEQRVTDEVRRQMRLNHPHLVTTWGMERSNGLCLLATEFVSGTDLSRLVHTRGTLTVAQAVAYCRQAAQALEYLHSRGLVHRSVQPAHLLLEESGQIRLLGPHLFHREESADRRDDALGRADDSEIAAATAASVAYIAPEQALDESRADARSDIYALGCTLFFLLTGRQPYEADSVVRQILAHRQLPIPSLRNSAPAASAALDAVFQRMVAKHPDDRYATVGELLSALALVDPDDDDSVLDFDLVPSPPLPRTSAPTREQMSRETAEVRVLARDDGTIMEMSVQTDPTPSRSTVSRSAGRPKPPNVEPRLWLFLALIVMLAALLLSLASWALTPKRGKGRSVRTSHLAVTEAKAAPLAPLIHTTGSVPGR